MTIATSLEELPDWADLTSRSGLEFMQAILDGQLAGAPIWQTLGLTLTDVRDGSVTIDGTPEFNALNPMRGLHGGWYGTLLDSCMACAVMTKTPRGSIYTTLEYKVNITRAIPPAPRSGPLAPSITQAVPRGLPAERFAASTITGSMPRAPPPA